MATIKPIKALRYTEKAGELSQCVCPPYDIISESERVSLCDNNPYNLVRLELPQGGDDRYANAGALLESWLEKGILKKDEQAGIFVYREEFEVEGKSYLFSGLICNVKLCDFSEKVILPHEETLKKAKEDRFCLMNATYCNFSPIYSLYSDDSGRIAQIISQAVKNAPEHRFTDNENVTHSLWKITDEDIITELTALFSQKQLFIADGHHRYETALRFRDTLNGQGRLNGTEADSVMMTLVDIDDKGLVIFPTHRLIKGISVNVGELKEKCRDIFEFEDYDNTSDIKKALESKKGDYLFALYTGGDGFTLISGKKERCVPKIDGHSDAYCTLDVTVLHTQILEKALNIDKENMANQKNLRYTRSIEEALSSVRGGECSAAFILNPTKINQIKAVSLAGDKMPQKSTYFYPKLKTGLVMNKLN